MTSRWIEPTARARGLSTHLLAPDELRAMARWPDLATLARALEERLALGTEGESAEAARLELALRRRAGAMLERLARWGSNGAEMAVLLDEEERRSLRALVRGAVSGAPPELRVAGLIPTPRLPVRALEELARLGTTSEIVALLRAWAHPDGDALAEEAKREHPDLFRLELALAVAHASRARAAARRGGDALRDFVSLTIDVDNCWSALSSPRSTASGAVPFLEGGSRIGRALHARALAEPDERAAATRLAPAFAGTPLGVALATGGDSGASLERAALETHLASQRRRSRLEPLGGAAVILFVLRLREELDALRRMLWGAALGAPPELRVPGGALS